MDAWRPIFDWLLWPWLIAETTGTLFSYRIDLAVRRSIVAIERVTATMRKAADSFFALQAAFNRLALVLPRDIE